MGKERVRLQFPLVLGIVCSDQDVVGGCSVGTVGIRCSEELRT